jgi:hypothetical protein
MAFLIAKRLITDLLQSLHPINRKILKYFSHKMIKIQKDIKRYFYFK